MLSREQVLTHIDRGQEVDVPELKGKARLRGLTVAEWDEIRPLFTEECSVTITVMCEIVVRCWVDDDGQRLFTPEDTPRLAKLPATVITRLALLGQSLSGLNGTPGEREKN